MKDDSRPNPIPLYLITGGSCLLALPGLYGTLILFTVGLEFGLRNIPAMLLPLLPLIGFLLLFGYIWTMVRRRFVGWLWALSFLYNLIILVLGVLARIYYFTANELAGYEILFILFIGWTIFMCVASGYYFLQSREAGKVNLT